VSALRVPRRFFFAEQRRDCEVLIANDLPLCSEEELYIFPTDVPGNLQDVQNQIQAPNGPATNPFSFAMSKMDATKVPGGTVKIVDSSIFNVSKTIAAAEVTVQPGGMRELHVSGIFFGEKRQRTEHCA
jgi:oxalate decarboxylase/phosphoglucose isomerase-like protein (cupin superfamily)